MNISNQFPRYEEYNPLVPVWCVIPNEGRCIHRFFDTSPFSPSGRYMAVLRLPQEERLPEPGEAAQVVLIDLQTAEEKVIYETKGWETQMGANINWGCEDTQLYFNDVDTGTWEPYCVRLNPLTGEKMRLEGTIYRISPDGKSIISSCMKRMRRTQYGYGVIVPDECVPRNYGFRDDDGLYITDTGTGKRRLLVSIRDVFDKAKPAIDRQRYEKGECYGFHCKFNPQGDRLIFTMRWFEGGEHQPFHMIGKHLYFWVLTMKPDGSDMYVAVSPEQWEKLGHHINWFPDGKKLSMNLCIDGDHKLYLVQANYDGSGLKKIHSEIPGSGHPTVHPDGIHILTDSYEREKISFGDGTIPLRFIDLRENTEKHIVRINIGNAAAKKISALRVDPHPAWAPDYRYMAFNGYVKGTRRVFVADMGGLLGH